jgi:hypothetical protein
MDERKKANNDNNNKCIITRESKDSLLRNMDLIMYVLYSGDEIFVMNMVKRVSTEVADKYDIQEIKKIIDHIDKPMLFRCLFFLMLNFHKEFRYLLLINYYERLIL